MLFRSGYRLPDDAPGGEVFLGALEDSVDLGGVVVQSRLQASLVGGVLDVIADDLGDIPPGALDVALRDGVY